jgi:hypothetical protein
MHVGPRILSEAEMIATMTNVALRSISETLVDIKEILIDIKEISKEYTNMQSTAERYIEILKIQEMMNKELRNELEGLRIQKEHDAERIRGQEKLDEIREKIGKQKYMNISISE